MTFKNLPIFTQVFATQTINIFTKLCFFRHYYCFLSIKGIFNTFINFLDFNKFDCHMKRKNKSDATFITTSQAADFLNLSIATVKKLLQDGAITSFKTPGGHHRIHKQELLEYIYQQTRNHKGDSGT